MFPLSGAYLSAAGRAVLEHKALAVNTLLLCGVGLMGADLDSVQLAVALLAVVVCAVIN